MSGFIYFIACEPMEAVKIGYTSKNPYSRLASLQTGCPSPLKLIAFVRGTIDEERRLHEAFSALHIQGEWFRYELKLKDLIFWLMGDDEASGERPRDALEAAIHDVLMQDGGWYPYGQVTQETYNRSGAWEPFYELLWDRFGPWDEE